ncbi:MAG: hypothetical protein ACOX4L_03765 [Bacillota bacterium]|jgi:hypothetical protein
MSKEQAISFLLLTVRDEELKRKYKGILNKYEGKSLTEGEQKKIILEEVIPLAKSLGFDFSTEDFRELLQPVKKLLTDEELDEAVGGRGQFSEVYSILEFTYTCELAPDDETFRMYYMNNAQNCLSYEPLSQHIYKRCCDTCKHIDYDVQKI